MRQRTLAIFAAITLVIAVAAIAVQSGRVGPTVRQGGGPLFADLAARINDARSITITAKGKSFSIAREDGVWSVTERGGYPARLETVKKALIGLAGAKSVEAKTSNPASYSRLDVMDPADEKAASVQITVKDGAGSALAALIVGKKRFAKGGLGAAMTYVRKAGEAQSWLAEGELEFADAPVGWIDKTLVDISGDRVDRVSFIQPDGQRVVIERDQDGEKKLKIKELPSGAVPKSDSELNTRASGLFGLELEDVRRAAEVPFLKQGAGAAEYHMRDGLVLRLTLALFEDRTWLAIEASVDETVAHASRPAAAGSSSDEEPADKLATPEMVREEADSINARARGWAYVVADRKLVQFKTRLADLLEPEDEKEDGPDADK